MRLPGWSIIFYAALTVTQISANEPLRYDISGSGNWYPYYIDNPDHPGLLPEMIDAILQRTGIQAVQTVLPAKRTNYALYKQQIDFEVISPQWLTPREQNDPHFVFSEPFLDIKEYLVTLKTNANKYPSNLDIVGKPVGTVRGYFYHDAARFKRVDFQSERELLLALQKKRVDIIIIGDLPARYWAHILNIDIEFGALHSQGKLHIRLLQKHRHLLEKINTAIHALDNEGALAAITARYTN